LHYDVSVFAFRKEKENSAAENGSASTIKYLQNTVDQFTVVLTSALAKPSLLCSLLQAHIEPLVYSSSIKPSEQCL
jgi:hypothetical protein